MRKVFAVFARFKSWTTVEVCGGVLVVAGVGMVYPPAAVIAAGGLLIGAANLADGGAS